MSYFRKGRSLGDDDPWASAGGVPVTTTQTSGNAVQASNAGFSSITGALSNLFGSASSASTAVVGQPKPPSSIDKVGSGIGAFLSALAPKPAPVIGIVPVQAGMSTGTKVAIVGGAAVLAAVILSRR